ncbi:hypothetical protein J6590_025107 [Homalodisca vitripennis]|nr:hypothetical protein J6590_025107 [Homalodisca vitripennis]
MRRFALQQEEFMEKTLLVSAQMVAKHCNNDLGLMFNRCSVGHPSLSPFVHLFIPWRQPPVWSHPRPILGVCRSLSPSMSDRFPPVVLISSQEDCRSG